MVLTISVPDSNVAVPSTLIPLPAAPVEVMAAVAFLNTKLLSHLIHAQEEISFSSESYSQEPEVFMMSVPPLTLILAPHFIPFLAAPLVVM